MGGALSRLPQCNGFAKLPKAEVFLTFGVDALVDYLQANQTGTDSHGRIGLDEGFIREILEIKDTEAGWRTIIRESNSIPDSATSLALNSTPPSSSILQLPIDLTGSSIFLDTEKHVTRSVESIGRITIRRFTMAVLDLTPWGSLANVMPARWF